MSEYLEGLELTNMEDDLLAKHVNTARIVKTKKGIKAVLKGMDTLKNTLFAIADLNVTL